MQNLCCRNVLNVKFPKIVAEKFAFYRRSRNDIVLVVLMMVSFSWILKPLQKSIMNTWIK